MSSRIERSMRQFSVLSSQFSAKPFRAGFSATCLGRLRTRTGNFFLLPHERSLGRRTVQEVLAVARGPENAFDPMVAKVREGRKAGRQWQENQKPETENCF